MKVREELRRLDELKAGDLIRYLPTSCWSITVSVEPYGKELAFKLNTIDSNGEIRTRGAMFKNLVCGFLYT